MEEDLDSFDIREKFLSYFEGKGSTRVKSASLIPHNDPTLLFVNAGMVQFKNSFLGKEKRDYVRATSCQKCIRAGGKHNDLDQVGYTARHHTFFEMLGNFSFGDYFKKKAIEFGWEFITKEMGFSENKLWITVYKDDDEAFNLWHKDIGVPESRILRLGERDNFWSMGDTGPCGPCSEIHIDQGEAIGCSRAECGVDCECDRFLELWNLVFMQFNRDKNGNMTKLPKPSIDTGLGLERITAIIEGVNSNYETDLLMPIIQKVAATSGKEYGINSKMDISLRVISDHIRAASFLISDGIIPEKTGRGYVLRRIIRRAVRHGKILGFDEPFLWQFSGLVQKMMSPIYPELIQYEDITIKTIKNEEEQFHRTLDIGLSILDKELSKRSVLKADTVFKLYDTYGFPVDITCDIARERNISVDINGFEALLNAQRLRSKKSWTGTNETAINPVYSKIIERTGKTKFVGYNLNGIFNSKVAALIVNGEIVNAAEGGDIEIVTLSTPFYGRAGGQIGDTGIIQSDAFKIKVTDTIKESALTIHKGTIIEGTVSAGSLANMIVDKERRDNIRRNHTATHLLQAALRSVLGKTVRQAGSLVTDSYLRFDFTYSNNISEIDLREVEMIVNNKISQAIPISTTLSNINEAMKSGAMALFGEKYGEIVRIVSCGDFSNELCGGVHADNSVNIGLFVIKDAKSIASGIKRIEAATGKIALNILLSYKDIVYDASRILSAKPVEIEKKITELLETVKRNDRRIKDLKINTGVSNERNLKIIQSGKYKLALVRLDNANVKEARASGDRLKQKIENGIICIVNDTKKRSIMIMTTESSIDASILLKDIMTKFNGKGGGNRSLAQGTIPKTADLNNIFNLLSTKLSKM